MHRLILLVILLIPACVRHDESARVIGISDGDTLTVLRGRTQARIRLHGIDAPETGQDYGSRAKQVASDLAFGKIVTVRPVEEDRYGRTVAEVILPDGRSMNREMVGRGAAWWYRAYSRRISGWRGWSRRRRRPDAGYGASRTRCRPGNGDEAMRRRSR